MKITQILLRKSCKEHVDTLFEFGLKGEVSLTFAARLEGLKGKKLVR